MLKQAPKTFSVDGLVVTQHEAISVDGERIPYVQTGPGTESGDAPVYMSAYGGFGLAVTPALQFGARQAVAGARRHVVFRRTSVAAASSARAGTMPAATPASGLRMMISPPSPPISSGAA